MGDKTGISWTSATWNPIRGCARVSEGCRHCYAETMAGRFSDEGQPYYQLAKRTKNGARWTGEIRFITEHLIDPVRWSKARKIFVNSMSDLFFEKLTNEEIAAIFGIMAVCKQHVFQVLTKRSKRMREWFEWAKRLTMPELLGYTYRALKDRPDDLKAFAKADSNMGGYVWPLPNVWLGVSVENQKAADERIPDLIACPAAIRFLSCEPLIGQVLLQGDSVTESGGVHARTYLRGITGDIRIHWVIAGCESGPGMRACDYRWLRTIRDQCQAAGVSYFLKQATAAQEGGHRLYPSGQAARAPVVDVVKLGKGSKMKPGGVIERPYLDNVQHQAFPA